MGHFESIGGRIDLSRAAVQAAGLREAQVGALWALAAHATISDEPAQVVLPTGVGKTIVAVLAPYVLRARRVLVVVPGKLIRSQVAAAFGDVGAAAETVGIFPGRMSTPKVAVAKHRATRESWDAWADVDVVIGTPSVLSPASGSVEPVPRDLFDLVIFDEAHHLPTSTWTALLVATDARAVLLTATPFRNDGKRLPGEMVYTYPLSRAIDAGVFGGVTYRAVDEVPREQLDVTLAREAVTRLRSPEHVAAASRLLVRTDSVAHARDLRDVYAAVGVSLGVIVHDTSWKRAEGMRQEVERGALAGFVCVGALTEGFNFPSLKIGVYHRPHKTLGPTLQFIGRLSRVGEVAGELIAPRSAVTDETAVLYREDVGWRRLLPDLVDSAIDHEREVRNFIQESAVRGPLELSPLTLTPARSVHVYHSPTAPNVDLVMEEVAGAEVVQTIAHRDSQTFSFVTRRIHRPRFMRLDLLDVPLFELHLATWVDDPGLLFISTSSLPSLQQLRRAFAPDGSTGLSAAELRRLLDAARFTRFFSIGTRSTRANSRTSYQTRSGSKTEDDLTPADARGWDLGHGMGRSGRGTFGFSIANSKVWEPGGADSLFAFRRWCEERASQIRSVPATRDPSKLDLFAISEPLAAFPSTPVVGVWPPSLFAIGASVAFDDELVAPELVDLVPIAGRSSAARVALALQVDGSSRGELVCKTDGSFRATQGVALFDPELQELADPAVWLAAEPPTLFFADGSRVVGDRLSEPPPASVPIDASVRRPHDWQGVNIRLEFDTSADGLRNVGTAVADLRMSEMPIVLRDHGSGEIADFIGINPDVLVPQVRLVHCKASGGSTPTARVSDVQELAAQAIRSVLWLAPGATLWRELLRRIDGRSATQVVRGSRADVRGILADWEEEPPNIEWSMWLAQPGLSNRAIDASAAVSTLLNAVHSWLQGEVVALSIICSV